MMASKKEKYESMNMYVRPIWSGFTLLISKVIIRYLFKNKEAREDANVAKESYLMFSWKKFTLPNNSISSSPFLTTFHLHRQLFCTGMVKLFFVYFYLCYV